MTDSEPTTLILTGNGSVPSRDVEAVLGRPATSFPMFAQRNAAAWTTLEEK
jgi:hypothetical protein